MRTRRIRRLAAVTTAVAALAAPAVIASPAYAGTGNTWCLSAFHQKCANAWNGGPFVKLYVGTGSGGSNSDFTLFLGGSLGSNVVLKFTGNSGWADGQHCIGAAANDPNRQDTSLDLCDIAGGNFGWGVLFTAHTDVCPFGYTAFRNNNSGGWLGPADANTNGSTIYRNKSNPFCFIDGPAA